MEDINLGVAPDADGSAGKEKQLDDLRLQIEIQAGGLNDAFGEETIQALFALSESEKHATKLEYLKNLLEKANRALEIYQIVRTEALSVKMGLEKPEERSASENQISGQLREISELALDFIEAVKSFIGNASLVEKRMANKCWQHLESLTGGDKHLAERMVLFLERQKNARGRASIAMDETIQRGREA